MKMICTDSLMEKCPVTNLPDCCLTCEQNEICTERCDYSREHETCPAAQPEQEEKNEVELFKSKEVAVIDAMVSLLEEKKKLEAKEKEVRKALTDAMGRYGVKSFECDKLTVTHIEATTKKTLDSKLLKKDDPDTYKKYLKESPVAASVRISLKKEGE